MMSNMSIPNILIKEINLFDSSNEQLSLTVKTIIENENNWSNTKTANHMKVLMVISSDADLNNAIANNETNFDVDFLKASITIIKKVKIFSNMALSPSHYMNGGVTVFMDSYEAVFDNTDREIKVFCSLYFETEEVLKNMNLDFTGQLRQYGAISSESVIELGTVSSTATVFLLKNNIQYTGPVHFHPDKGYMVGSKHIDGPHETLKTLEVSNFKIKDFRKKQYPVPISSGHKIVSSYSNLSYSINRKGNATGIFQ